MVDLQTERPTSMLFEPHCELRLLGGFGAVRSDDCAAEIPSGCQRLVAFLALRERPTQRVHVAGTLWMDKDEDRACANLRSTLWRLRRSGFDIIEEHGQSLTLRHDVQIDYRECLDWSKRIVSGIVVDDDLRIEVGELAVDLLPGWYDDWVLMERERVRQLMLHALELVVDRLSRRGAYGRAIDVGLGAIALEPLRESSHRAVVAAHIAEGNVQEALRHFDLYRNLVLTELGLEPSPEMMRLVDRIAVAR